jgi:hypothetical protein
LEPKVLLLLSVALLLLLLELLPGLQSKRSSYLRNKTHIISSYRTNLGAN